MRKYTYQWFLSDVKNGHRLKFQLGSHVYSIENTWKNFKHRDYFLGSDGERISDYYNDGEELVKSIKIEGKSFKELFDADEQGKEDIRLIFKF